MSKTVKVDRWENQIEIQVPDSSMIIESEAKPVEGLDPIKNIENAIDNPFGMERIEDIVNSKSKVALAFDDPQKFCPSYLTLPVILNRLRKIGVKEENITLISAGGTHRRWMPSEFLEYRSFGYGLPIGRGIPTVPKDIFYEFWPNRFIRHDASDPNNLIQMGYSKLGDLVEVNRILIDSDLVIYTGGIYPMDWGGFGGTGVVIGLSSARSIAFHHSVNVFGHLDSCHGDPSCHLYRSHKDAVMERIEEYTGKKVFFIEGVSNGARQWTHFFAGHFREILEPTWNAANQDRLYPIEQGDLVIAGLPKWVRYDTTNNPIICLCAAAAILRCWVGKPILREGGVIILVGACNGSIDMDTNPSYAEALELYGKMGNAHKLEERYLNEFLNREDYIAKYRFGNSVHPVHPFWLFSETDYVHNHAGKLIIATAENPEAVRKIEGTWAEDFNQAMEIAKRIVGSNPKTVVLPTYFSRPPVTFSVK